MPSFSNDSGYGPYGSPPIQPPAPRNSSGGVPGWNPNRRNLFRDSLNSYLGGMDPMAFLRAQGMNFTHGSPQTSFSQDGRNYTSVGSSHEGGGFGGQSSFLQGLGYQPGQGQGSLAADRQYGGDIAKMDKAMAAVSQGNISDVAHGLTTADKQAMAASGKDIFGNSAFGVTGGAHGTPGGGKPPVVSTNTPPGPSQPKPGPAYQPRDPRAVTR